MKKAEYLSIIILNYNSYDDTMACVGNLINFHCGFHIIIVDNQSIDDSYLKLKSMYQNIDCICVIQSNKNGGYSYGNNFGIRYAIEKFGSKIVGIMNPDIIIRDYSVFTTMCNALMDYPKLAVIGASTLNPDGTYNPNNSGWDIPTGRDLVKWHFLKNNRKKKEPKWEKISDSIAQVECVAGCFFLAKTDILQELGYLDENVFLYHEENILGIKCKAAGYVEGIVLNKYYIHNHRHIQKEKVSFWEKIKTTKNVYKSTQYLLKTYYSNIYLPALFIVECANKCYLGFAHLKNNIAAIKDGRI